MTEPTRAADSTNRDGYFAWFRETWPSIGRGCHLAAKEPDGFNTLSGAAHVYHGTILYPDNRVQRIFAETPEHLVDLAYECINDELGANPS